MGSNDPSRSSALEAVSLTKAFGGVVAVRDVTLKVGHGEVCGLIGPNGAGKTTLFDLLSGVVAPTSGTVRINGHDVTAKSATWRARAGVRRTFQRQQPFGWLTVEDNLLVALEWKRHRGSPGLTGERWRRAGSVRRERVNEILSLLELDALRTVPAAALTIGQSRLVEMARAVVAEPQILLLDEPTSGLAVGEVEHISRAIAKLRKSCAIVLVEHDVGFVLQICDNITVLNRGSVLAAGTPIEIRQNSAVTEAYLGTQAKPV